MYNADQFSSLQAGKIEAEMTTLDGNCPFSKLMGQGITLWHDSIKGICAVDSLLKHVLEASYLEDLSYDYSNARHRLIKEHPEKKADGEKVKNAKIILYWVQALKIMVPELAELGPTELSKVFGCVYSAVDEYSQNAKGYFDQVVNTVKSKVKDERVLLYLQKAQDEWDKIQDARTSRFDVKACLYETLLAFEVTVRMFIYIEQSIREKK